MLRCIGHIQFLKNEDKAALASYKQAEAIRMKTNTMTTEDGANLLTGMGAVKATLKGEDPLKDFERAQRILDEKPTDSALTDWILPPRKQILGGSKGGVGACTSAGHPNGYGE